MSSVSKYTIDQDYVPPEKKNIISMKDALREWVALRRRASNIDTGFHYFDKEMKLFDPGQVCMIAGRAGSFKTTAGMQIANQLAKSLDSRCLFASLEMTSQTVAYRAASIEGSKEGVGGEDF